MNMRRNALRIIIWLPITMLLASCDGLIEKLQTQNEQKNAAVTQAVETAKDELPQPKKSNAKLDANSAACLTEAMYFEARGTGRTGMRAVGEVVLNRANSSRFPNSICGVVDQRWGGSCQFSYRCDGIPEIYREPQQKSLAQDIARELLTNRGKDITNGAQFFHAARIKPGWFATLQRRGVFGKQIFYR